MSKNSTTFNKIRAVRKSKRISVDKLAKAADLTVTHINRMESGKHFNPNLGTLRKLANALDVSVCDLIEDKKLPLTPLSAALAITPLLVCAADLF